MAQRLIDQLPRKRLDSLIPHPLRPSREHTAAGRDSVAVAIATTRCVTLAVAGEGPQSEAVSSLECDGGIVYHVGPMRARLPELSDRR